MLNRQYGIAASSSIVQVVHPEDSQPNEAIHGRNRNQPPKLNTVRPPRFSHPPSGPSRLGTQLARRGSWNTRLPTRARQEISSWPNPGPSGPRHHHHHHHHHHLPEAPASSSWPTSAAPPAAPPVQQNSSSASITHFRSPSPKLPLEPIRRRTPLDAPRYRPSDRPPLPGRKRKASEAPHSELPPPQKLKIDQPKPPLPPPSHRDIKQERSSPESVPTPRKLVNEACSFWPTPDNCRKSVPDHSANRREFAKAKNKELIRLGLKRTKAFFRDDGLVIEWSSQVPVWNDTLLPAKKQQPATSSETSYPAEKRKRIIEIIDVDALPDAPLPKKSRPSDLEASARKQSESPSPSPSPHKHKKIPPRHWSVGLAKQDIRKLGRSVEAASSKPPPSSSESSLVTRDKRASAVSSPPKRLALPTRLTPSERKIVSAAYSITASSSPEARSTLDPASDSLGPPATVYTAYSSTAASSPDKEARSTLDAAPDSARRSELPATVSSAYSSTPDRDKEARSTFDATPDRANVNSDTSQEPTSKPPPDSDVVGVHLPPPHHSTAVVLESTNKVDAPAGAEALVIHVPSDVGEGSSSGLPDSDTRQESTSKPPFNSGVVDVHLPPPPPQSTAVLLESTNDVGVSAGAEIHVESATSNVGEESTIGVALDSLGLPATTKSDSGRETTSKPPSASDVVYPPQSSAVVEESADKVDATAGGEMAVTHIDSSTSDVGEGSAPDRDTNQEATSKSPSNSNDVDVHRPTQSTAVVPESTTNLDAPAGADMVIKHVDPSASHVVGEAGGSGAQHSDNTFVCDNDSGPQTADTPVEGESETLNPDEEAAAFEAESQEIERLCTEESSLDLPEYDMAEDFLRQFISFFDADRNELKMAYSNDALLSFREPNPEPGTPIDTLPSPSSKTTLHIGRTEIINRLNGLIGYHFSPVGEVPSNSDNKNNTITYDIAVLSEEVIDCKPLGDGSSVVDKAAVGGVLVTLHSQILRSSSSSNNNSSSSGSGLDRAQALTLDQSFVLRRRTALDDDDASLDSDESTSNLKVAWPLIVTSHHMILRDELLLSPPSQPFSLDLVQSTDQP